MAIFNVTNNNASGEGSLQAAIAAANASEGLDRIVVNADINNIEIDSALFITDSVDITGNGVVVTQTGSDRLFNIDDNDTDNLIDVSMSDISLTGGKPVEMGGAIYATENLTITNAKIYDNHTSLQGGGIYSESALLRVESSEIYDNSISEPTKENPISAGSGLYVRFGGRLELIDSKVENNDAKIDSIVIAGGSQGFIDNSQITNNTGGGVGVIVNSHVEIENSLISFNTTDLTGGGVAVDLASAKITNTTISNNSAYIGGGIALYKGSLELIDSDVVNNQAEEDGGGIDVFQDSNLTIIGSTISGNSAISVDGISSFDADLNGADISSTILVKDSTVTDSVQENVVIVTTPVEEPVAEEAAVEEPTVVEPVVTEAPVEVEPIEETLVDEPTVEEVTPEVIEPVVETPVVEETVVEAPVVEPVTVVEETTPETPVVEETVEETISEAPVLETSEVEPAVEESTIEEVEEAEASLELTEVHRFYQYQSGFHFYTADDNESNVVQARSEAGELTYNYEGESFAALASNQDGLTGEVIEGAAEVSRFFNTDTGAHLYTMDVNEKEHILDNLDNYVFEGTAYYAFAEEQENTIPVFRMLNGSTGTHLLTTDVNELNYIQENLPHFSLEADNGVAFHVLEI